MLTIIDDTNSEELQKTVRIFRILSDESRVRILWLLMEQGEMYVSDITDILNLSQSNVSHHLSLLELLGFVSKRRDPADGRRIGYKIEDDCIEDILRRTKDHVQAS